GGGWASRGTWRGWWPGRPEPWLSARPCGGGERGRARRVAMMVGMVDWSLTRRIATTDAGQPPPPRPRPELPEVVAESERLVAAYAELHPPAPLPPPELLARHQWIDANLRTMPTLLEPLMAKVGEGAGALAPAIRVGAATV